MIVPSDGDDAMTRRRLDRAVDLLRRLWCSGLARRPDLSELAAHGRADGGGWRQALGRLVESLEREAALNPVGLTFAHVQITQLLRQRERAERLWSARPDIAQVAIPRPIVVLGHMRSGTTRVQRLLGCDPRLNHTRFFEVMSPFPAALDWRLPASWAQLKMLHWLNPQLQAVHPTAARDVEEAFGLLSFSFYGAQFEAQWHVPGFARWWEEQDRGWVYDEFRHLLQSIAWQRRASAAPFVLKAPQFMEDLEPLLDVFPDARLICLSRNPEEVVTSSSSLVWNQMRIQSDSVSRAWIGREWLRKTARRDAICAEVRARRSDVPQIDVAFDAVTADWRGEMRRVYSFLDLELTAEVERRMERYLSAAEASGFRGHRYRSADFGLDRDIVRAALSPA